MLKFLQCPLCAGVFAPCRAYPSHSSVLAQTCPHPWLSLANNILLDRLYHHIYVIRNSSIVAEFAVDSAETAVCPWGYIVSWVDFGTVSWFKRSVPGLAMAEARLQIQTSTRGIYDGQSVTGTRFPPSSSVFFTNTPYSFTYLSPTLYKFSNWQSFQVTPIEKDVGYLGRYGLLNWHVYLRICIYLVQYLGFSRSAVRDW